ncbi:hypothetical protein SMA90_33170, partial [Escherichia coli]
MMRAPSLGRIMLGVSLALVASGSGSAQEVPPVPFYADKMNLLVYLDDEGEHPVTTLDEWAVRRSHILANMQLVMGPLPGP